MILDLEINYNQRWYHKQRYFWRFTLTVAARIMINDRAAVFQALHYIAHYVVLQC